FPAPGGPRSIAIDPSSRFAFVANAVSGTVSVFGIFSASGALTPVPGSPYTTGAFPSSLAIAAPPSPAQLITSVQALIDAGALNKGQGNSLITKLDHVIESLNRGKKSAACGQLGAFINEVTSLINNGVLTPAQGQPLINAATLFSNTGCS